MTKVTNSDVIARSNRRSNLLKRLPRLSTSSMARNDDERPQTILLSGGAGFLGSNLAVRLINDNHQLIAIDDLSTGNRQNLDELLIHPNFKFIKHDIRQPINIDKKFDYVLNLACPASPPRYYEDPIKTLETNSIGTKNMLDLAVKNQARFFQTSTSEVYGNPLEHPQKESYFGNVEPYAKRSCYDEGKRYAEALIWQYRHLHHLDTGIIRIFNTYGPRMDPKDGRVVTNFIDQTLNNQDITIQGTGEQTRSFCYIDDQIEGMLKMIFSKEEGPINIGNPEEFSINQLADLVIKLTNSKSKKIYTVAAVSDPERRRPDISLAKSRLGWEPKVDLEEGLKKTIKWMRNR